MDELQKDGHFSFGLSSVSLETNMILHNIQRIFQVWIEGYFPSFELFLDVNGFKWHLYFIV